MMGAWDLELTGPSAGPSPAEYKANLLAEYEAADRGERGAILRREGLYSRTSWSGARLPMLVPVPG
jgi:hypothetical protein